MLSYIAVLPVTVSATILIVRCFALLIAEVRNGTISSGITILQPEVDSLAQQITAQNGNGATLHLSHLLILLPNNYSRDKINQAKVLAIFIMAQSKTNDDFSQLIKYSTDAHILKVNDIRGDKIIIPVTEVYARHILLRQEDRRAGPRQAAYLYFIFIPHMAGT